MSSTLGTGSTMDGILAKPAVPGKTQPMQVSYPPCDSPYFFSS